VGGMGSLAGAFVAALLIGLLESFGKVSDFSGLQLLAALGMDLAPDATLYPVFKLTMSQVAPVLPYLLLVVILIVRPKGLLGTRED
jgi:branched-chain amino acid transport system permease protein